MNVRKLAQCYRCRRIFAARGGERFCPECAAALRRYGPAGALGALRESSAAVVVFGGLALLLLAQGRSPLPSLLALALVFAWYLVRGRA